MDIFTLQEICWFAIKPSKWISISATVMCPQTSGDLIALFTLSCLGMNWKQGQTASLTLPKASNQLKWDPFNHYAFCVKE